MAQVETVTANNWTPKGEVEVYGPDRPQHRKQLVFFGGIPGERAQVKVTSVGKNRAYGFWVDSEQPSPVRVTPPCEKFGPCGGCPLMHVTPKAASEIKRDMMANTLREAGLGDVPIGKWHDCPDGQENFRHVVKIGWGRSDKGRIRLGAWGRNQRHIIPIPHCNVATPTLRRAMNALAHHAIEMELWPWERQTGAGVMRSAVLRQSRTTGEIMVTLIAGKRIRQLTDYAEAIANGVSEVVGVWLHVNDDPGNSIYVRDGDGVLGVRALCGKATIDEELNGIRYGIGPGDFFQTNPSVAEVLYARTIERLQLEEGVPVLDLFCGVGGFALQAARVTGWALGIEDIDSAVQRAREAARRNEIRGAEFLSDRVDLALPDLQKRLGKKRPVITVNPPRRGLEPSVIEGMLALNPRKIAYISCGARALARDLAIFRTAGFDIGEVELFDMFPNTAHYESLTVLTAPDADSVTSRAPRRKVVRK